MMERKRERMAVMLTSILYRRHAAVDLPAILGFPRAGKGELIA